MVDFCNDAPGRRAGMAQIFLNDIPAAVEEIRWAREQNLFGGILLPGVPPDSGLPPLIAPDYEPIWQVCEELDMPINNHSGQSGPDFGSYPASMAIWMIELGWFSHRVFWHMVFGGVFGRHPGLKLVLTEQSAGWVPGALALLDHHYERFLTPGAAEAHFGGAIAAEMKMSPSECWNQNCYAGASFFRPSECKVRYKIGVDRIMWGQDYPHGEGTYPYTREALQNTFAGVPTDEVALMVGGNAAEVYGFDLDALAPVAERGRPDHRADVPAARRDPRRHAVDGVRGSGAQALVSEPTVTEPKISVGATEADAAAELSNTQLSQYITAKKKKKKKNTRSAAAMARDLRRTQWPGRRADRHRSNAP